jgi:outer membrane receptor protein involved in Fe transport
MTNFSIHLLRGGSVLALALATACGPAAAQTADGDTDIIVTGSRLGRTSFNSPTPVNQISDARMKDLAIPTVADALNQLPSFRASGTPTANLFRISGAIGANAVDLRGLGSTRTLTLLDGRRFVPSTDSGAVDLNTIPSALVQRTEVVTGGASAAYGANAVAGVVNLILDTKFSGIKTDINGGISEQGDARNYGASFAAGKDFAGERGHFVFGVEYQKNEGIGPCLERDFCARGTNYMSNPGYINGVSTNGLPATLVYPNVYFVQNPTGVLVSAIQTVGGVRTTLGQQVNNTGASSCRSSSANC